MNETKEEMRHEVHNAGPVSNVLAELQRLIGNNIVGQELQYFRVLNRSGSLYLGFSNGAALVVDIAYDMNGSYCMRVIEPDGNMAEPNGRG